MSTMIPADLTHHTIPTNGINLHAVTAGPQNGKPVILLHGFPEFWYGWRAQIPHLAGKGFRVIVPDQRGYNLSEKPGGIAAYNLDYLVADVIGLADALGLSTFRLVGHDWGAAVSWWLAAKYPDRLEKLVILNVPHHRVMARQLRRSADQRRKSWYMAYFQIPLLPEISVRGVGFRPLFDAMVRSARPGIFGDEDYAQYRKAWSQPGAMTAMINWYRAVARIRLAPAPREKIRVPTLLIWGTGDAFLGTEMAQPSIEMCEDGRLVLLNGATHWVQHTEAERVNTLLSEFLS